MRRLHALALMAMLAAPLTIAQAQQRVAVGIRGIVAAPAGKLVDTKLGTGFGIGGVVAFRVQEHLHVYGGWDWVMFKPDASFAGSDLDFEETGYTFGLRFEHPFRGENGDFRYRLEGGGTYKHVEIENADGDLIVNSGHSLGYEAGVGLVFARGEAFQVIPAVRFRSLSPEFRIGSTTSSGNLRYVAFELGLSKRFW